MVIEFSAVVWHFRSKENYVSATLMEVMNIFYISEMLLVDSFVYVTSGFLVHAAYQSFQVGYLMDLPESCMLLLIDYLVYRDVLALRDSCQYLHNLTRSLRLKWSIFPFRRVKFEQVVYLFLKHSVLVDGTRALEVCGGCHDGSGQLICLSHLEQR